MKVFITGCLGYVGNILTRMLSNESFEIIGCDSGYYPQDFVETKPLKMEKFFKKDIRNINEQDLKDCVAVIHLAALSNDPLGQINSSLTNEVNYLSTIRLAKLAKKAGVERFVFSSSCSTYGANSDVVDENSLLAPITAYAKSKVDSEQDIIELKDEYFSPIILRSATAYGVSPSIRLDLVVNNLTGSAFTTGNVRLLSDGSAWRPLVHVEDMSYAFTRVLQVPKEKVSGEIFNVGSNEENYTVRQIAEMVEDIVPDSKITYANESSKDSRSYRVNFDKIKNQIGYKTKWNLKKGIKELYEVFKNNNLTEDEFKSRKYYRLEYIKWLIETNALDDNLYFRNSAN